MMGYIQATWRPNWKSPWILRLCRQQHRLTTQLIFLVKSFLLGLSGLYLYASSFLVQVSLTATRMRLLRQHNHSLRNFCPPVWSWRTSQAQPVRNTRPTSRALNESSTWALPAEENEEISAHLTWTFFTSHLLSFKCMENLHFTAPHVF